MPNASLQIGLQNIARDFADVCNLIPAENYVLEQGENSSIGAHARHVLEFLQAILNVSENGVLDYEMRARNTLYESNNEATKIAFAEIIENLSAKLTGSSNDIIVLESAGYGLEKTAVKSSIHREVLFAIQHSVHHFAMIKMIAQKQGISLHENFGVTAATQQYRQSLKSFESA